MFPATAGGIGLFYFEARMATTKAEAQAYITALKTAYTAVMSGTEYTMTIGGNTRRMKRNDMKTLREEIEYWEQYIDDLDESTQGLKMKFGVPHK